MQSSDEHLPGLQVQEASYGWCWSGQDPPGRHAHWLRGAMFLAEGFPRAPSPCLLHSVDHLAVWGKSTWETHGGRLRVGPAMGAVLALACPWSQRPGSLAVFSMRWVGSTSRGLRVVTREPPKPRHVG